VIGGGSGTGIAALINGTVDIAQASRAMKADEKRQFILNFKRKALEIPVALDGIVVVVNKQKPRKIADARTTAQNLPRRNHGLEGFGGAPGANVTYGREKITSGTYAYFKEHVLKEQDFSPRTQTLADGGHHQRRLEGRQCIGYSGHGYSEGVKMTGAGGGRQAEAVEPDEAHVASGRIRSAVRFFLYVDQANIHGHGRGFRDYCLSPEGQAIVMETGYFPVQKKEKADGSASAEATPAATPRKTAGINPAPERVRLIEQAFRSHAPSCCDPPAFHGSGGGSGHSSGNRRVSAPGRFWPPRVRRKRRIGGLERIVEERDFPHLAFRRGAGVI
jgi:phosphate transport system substrate-binding protein